MIPPLNVEDPHVPPVQQYPPGSQNNYMVFLNLFVVTETSNELNCPKDGKEF